ncbi:hypothetical protein BOO71_0001288 [Deinococcus marmoris]|uniref:BIG2 domain-containing protein n=2 Tax=Deinococcus marmoris TaxID=249408 RepID=A0A1U7P3X3_9DEIO|nr:hypothetical protein BOO71_0001288 [Deinococcus marmoris]
MFRRPVSIALALTASIAIVSCGDTKTPTATVTNVAITAPAGSAATLTVGATTKAIASVVGTNTPAQTVNWSSSVPAVATVDATGLIKAVTPGTTVVKATSTVDTSKSAQVTITVNAVTSTTPTVTAVAVTLAPTTVAVGGTSQATASVTGTNSPAQTVTWTSSNTAVATVSAAGVVTSLIPGTADIIGTSTVDNTKKGQATLTVTAVVTNRPTVKINFAPATSPVVGYDTNSGAAYTAASMTGWITEASAGTATPVPLDMTGNVRPSTPIVLATAEPAQLTQINMQCGTPTTGNPCASGTTVSGAFEYKMADGKYNVTVSVGDASASTNAGNTNSSHTINVEGTNIFSNKTVTSAAPFFKNATPVAVTVTGGVMTIDAKGGMNTKINYIELVPVN